MEHVDTLHLLVHPDWDIHSALHVTDRARELFDRYQEKARSFSPREMMIAVLCLPPKSATAELETERFVFEKISQLKETLRHQLHVLSNGFSMLAASDAEAMQIWHSIKKAAAARGYSIDSDTQGAAYGMTYTKCVPHIAKQARNAYALKQPVIIPAHYTNLGFRDGETLVEEHGRFTDVSHECSYTSEELITDWTVPGVD